MKTRVLLAALLILGGTVPAVAHRLNEYLQATTVAVALDSVTLQVHLTAGVDIAANVIAGVDPDHDGTLSTAEAQAYAENILRDLSLTIDGRPAMLQLQSWSFVSLSEMASGQGESTVTMTAAFTGAAAAHELTLENRHQRGVAAYLVNALQPDVANVRIDAQRRNYDQSHYTLNFTTGATAAGAETSSGSSAGPIITTYAWHGLTHILGGYDHLLFLGALVLAAATFWDLVKVVTAFTVAHSLTLTLAALNLVHLPGLIVEPSIAASIIFVALQNVFWPQQARGRSRLIVAFFFGLFHGLGFAGGLVDMMQQMPTSIVLLAVLGFSLGVEAGNQLVMLPLFSGLRLARGPLDIDSEAWLASKVRRVGSTGISVAGSYYLLIALTPAS